MGRLKRSNRPPVSRQPEKHLINEKIQKLDTDEVRVISQSGEQMGIKSLQEAITLAQEAGLDLVAVSPDASPPVCKIIDYGKYKYQLQKKESEAKKNRTETQIKELKLGYCTDVGDLNTKIKHARKFLANGCKVKLSMRFKGREKAFMSQGREKLDSIVEQLSDVASIDGHHSRSGNQIQVLLAPC